MMEKATRNNRFRKVEKPEVPKRVESNRSVDSESIQELDEELEREEVKREKVKREEVKKEEFEKEEVKKEEKKKEVLIEFILDTTYSFTRIFPKIHYVLEKLIKTIQAEKKEYRGAIVKYGLTIFHDEPYACPFLNGQYFTENEDEFLSTIRNVSFYGGSADGREDLNKALNTGLRMLQRTGQDGAYRGILMFSDSLPKEDDLNYDFLNYTQDGYYNRGVRFAMFYTYNDDFTPNMRIVDRDGNPVENNRNEMTFHSIQELLGKNDEFVIEKIQKIVKSILSQASVSNN